MIFWGKRSVLPVLKGYVSEFDQFLQAFDQNTPAMSESRRFEEAKAQRISKLRDDASAKENPIAFCLAGYLGKEKHK
jgi:hypothetical protein